MLKFIAIFILFGSLAFALAIILLALTKIANDRYWEDVKGITTMKKKEKTNSTKDCYHCVWCECDPVAVYRCNLKGMAMTPEQVRSQTECRDWELDKSTLTTYLK